jgi:hypothetical protein
LMNRPLASSSVSITNSASQEVNAPTTEPGEFSKPIDVPLAQPDADTTQPKGSRCESV